MTILLKRPAYRATKGEWATLQRIIPLDCVRCGSQRGTELAHVVDRSDGGDDVAENLMRLCGDFGVCRLHARRHRPSQSETTTEMRSLMRAVMSAENVAYGVGFYGPEAFDRLYPPPERRSAA